MTKKTANCTTCATYAAANMIPLLGGTFYETPAALLVHTERPDAEPPLTAHFQAMYDADLEYCRKVEGAAQVFNRSLRRM